MNWGVYGRHVCEIFLCSWSSEVNDLLSDLLPDLLPVLLPAPMPLAHTAHSCLGVQRFVEIFATYTHTLFELKI